MDDFKYYFTDSEFYGYDPVIGEYRKFNGYSDYSDYFDEISR